MHNQLKKIGYWQGLYKGIDLDSHLLNLAKTLGNPIGGRKKSKLIETLKPITSDMANSSSLSKRFALSEFPLHCDTAHWITPCRYLVFGCKEQGNCGRNTTLVDWKNIPFNSRELQLLKDAVFLVKDGENSFYCSIIVDGENFFRFDVGCMYPVNKNSENILKILQRKLLKASKIEVSWRKNKVLIIDNWRVLHGRGAPNQVLGSLSTRELHRVLVA